MKQIIGQDVNGWYTRLNAVLLKHGLTAVSVPDIAGPAKAEQVTPLTDKLESMKADTYYKLASYSDWGSVVKGALMKELTPTGIEYDQQRGGDHRLPEHGGQCPRDVCPRDQFQWD